MSANYPPPQQPQQPQQPPAGQNPYAQSPYAQQQPAPGPYAQPQQPQQQWGAPQPGAPGAFNGAAYPPPAPVAPARDNVGIGILAGLAAALVAAVLYGLIIKGTKHEIGYAALAVGALVGYALGKVGGRNPVLPIIGVPLALFAVYAGQIIGITLLIGDSPGAPGFVTILTDHFGLVQDAWKEAMGGMDIFFFALAGLEGFVVAKRVAR
jgi:hypothetical protein